QNSLAQRNGRPRSAARRRAVTYSGSAWISRLDCCQKRTSPVSRNSQPLPTMPCREAGCPVSIAACAVQVTAGTVSVSRRCQPASARAFRRGACVSKREGRPTASTSTSRCMGPLFSPLPLGERGRGGGGWGVGGFGIVSPPLRGRGENETAGQPRLRLRLSRTLFFYTLTLMLHHLLAGDGGTGLSSLTRGAFYREHGSISVHL